MKCDSVRPACTPCSGARRASECEYNDGIIITKTQLLYAKLGNLERHLRFLQNSTSNYGHQDSRRASPQLQNNDSASSGEFPISPVSQTESNNHAFHSPSTSGQTMEPGLPNSTFTIPRTIHESDFKSFSIILLNAFLPHAQQCGLGIPSDELVVRMSMSWSAGGVHRALKNAIWLWGCHFFAPASKDNFETNFLRRALEGLHDLLNHSDRLLEAVQTSCLLSTYYFANVRMLEGSYHANTASQLAKLGGLHQLRSGPSNGNSPNANSDVLMNFEFPSSANSNRGHEELHAFWNTFVLERSWAGGSGRASPHWNSHDSKTIVTSPWPTDVGTDWAMDALGVDYPDGYSTASSTFENFLKYPTPSSCKSELRAKSVALWERSISVEETKESIVPMAQPDEERWSEAHNALHSFYNKIPSLPHCTDRTSSYAECMIFTAHALIHAADIRMHCHDAAYGNSDAHEHCMSAARKIEAAVNLLHDDDFPYLEPIVGACWTICAAVLIRGLRKIPRQSDSVPSERDTISVQLENIASAIARLGKVFPVAASQLNKINAIRKLFEPETVLVAAGEDECACVRNTIS
ncbi:hypothetical protein BD410DRAFT_793065 [Rickenella mellea]|uniref:Transcription factor domain-containing protein n=1 Tax=Rickenella mellea TaxID=50990 RepID=A0A4Y7PUA6_9AGAM|nr:hypothetical protein BD410DRAFT_793065 [Rickenella mellea]